MVESTRNYLRAYDWSLDDKQAAYCEFVSNTVSRENMNETKTGVQKRLEERGFAENGSNASRHSAHPVHPAANCTAAGRR